MSSSFDSTEDIEINIRKIEHILNYSKGQGFLIVADSNVRSKTCYEITTNQRRKALEEYLSICNLNMVNHRTEPTFETTRGSSYVDLTIVNNELLSCVTDWTCGIQECYSDHKILSFNLGMDRQDKPIKTQNTGGSDI